MRMRAFKSHGMNRVIARGISHAVNNHYRYNRSRSYNSSNSSADAGLILIMFLGLLFILGACSAF